MTAAIMVAALALDSLTYLMVEPHEANPIVNLLGPGSALLIRWLAVVAFLVLVRLIDQYSAFRRPLYLLGALVGLIGAAGNTRTLLIYGRFA